MESFLLSQWNAFIRYFDLPGEAPVRVYLPGLGAAATSLLDVAIHPLIRGNRSLLVDFLGSGFSDQPKEFSYSLEDHARTIAELLDHLKLKQCALIGHSLGGSVAITLAALRPDLVSRLVVAEGNLDAGGGSFSKSVAAQTEQDFVDQGYASTLEWLRTAAINGDAGLAALSGMFQIAAPYAVYRGAVSLVEGTQPTLRERFYQAAIPRRFVFGERSVPSDPTKALPDAPDPAPLVQQGIQVLVVPNAGHGMFMDNPAGSAQALQTALAP